MRMSQSTTLLLAYALAIAGTFSKETSARHFSVSTKTCFPFVPKSITDLRSTKSLLDQLCFRGGDDSTSAETETSKDEVAAQHEEPTLDEKVNAAMRKLGLSPPSGTDEEIESSTDCKDGVCAMPQEPQQPTDSAEAKDLDPHKLAEELADEFSVDESLAMAAIGATSSFEDGSQRVFDKEKARSMIQRELELISNIPEESDHVQQLVKEGHDTFLSRRALAFAENDIENARAILIADQMDEAEEAADQETVEKEADLVGVETEGVSDDEDEEAAIRAQLRAEKPKLVEVESNFDPTATLKSSPAAAPKQQQTPNSDFPKPAAKNAVVFEATTSQIQELVIESPVPVLLDIHAEWCGPCKALGPALEEMAVKAGGIFRLVKVNSDNERPISAALEITSLPTVLGIRDGKIVHMFKGMPRSEEFMKNFMLGLFGAGAFQPPVTAEEKEKYEELTSKLLKTAGAASFSFALRERLQDRIESKLSELVQDESVRDVEGSAMLLRTLITNIITNPDDTKYRKINLQNKVISEKISKHSACLSILKSIGFKKSTEKEEMYFALEKKVVNVAPFVCARDSIDKWIERNRNEMAAAARRRKDEADRARLLAQKKESAEDEEELEEEDEEDEAKTDPTACTLKVRLDGKKKVEDVVLDETDPLSSILDALSIKTSENEEIQITCVAKRLVVKSSDEQAMKKSLRDHRLTPSASIVVKVGSTTEASEKSSNSIKERAAEKKNKRKGSHTMQSVGIYAKDDKNKAELIDGGGGVWYEHDVTDDEDASADQEANATEEGDVGDEINEQTEDEVEDDSSSKDT